MDPPSTRFIFVLASHQRVVPKDCLNDFRYEEVSGRLYNGRIVTSPR
jgi:hypothetical protein